MYQQKASQNHKENWEKTNTKTSNQEPRLAASIQDKSRLKY